MTYAGVIDVINIVGLLGFLLLLGVAVGSMILRLIRYRQLHRHASIILRRDLALLGTLALAVGSGLLIRALAWGPAFTQPGPLRLVYISSIDLLAIAGLGYWTWAELFVIGTPGHEQD